MDDALISIDDVVEGAVLEALASVGEKETGWNSGPFPNLALAAVGLPPGNEWCAASVYFWFMRSAAKLSTTNPCPRSAGVLRMLAMCHPHQRTTFVRRGCLFFVDHGGGKGHAGIVTADDGAGNCVDQVSGNTNEEGSRLGNAVAMHHGDPMIAHHGLAVTYVDFRLPAPPLTA